MGDGAPQVGVIMGSQSDWPTMAHAVQILEQFGIAHEVRIVSAHRTPDRLVDYAKSAAGRGLRAIIAGARSEENTSELQSLMRISYACFCLKKKQIETSV